MPILSWTHVSIKNIFLLARKYDRFPRYDAPARFIEYTVGNIVVIILSIFFGKEDIGCFSMVVQFILLPITVIGSAMSTVYYREITIDINDTQKIANATIKVSKISLVLSILPILFLALGGDKLLVLFLGQKWESAGMMALCLVIYSLPVILSEPLLPAYRALDKQDTRLKFNGLNLLISVGGLISGSLLISNIYWVIIIYAICYSLVRFLMLGYIYKITGVSIKAINQNYLLVISISYLFLAFRICYNFMNNLL